LSAILPLPKDNFRVGGYTSRIPINERFGDYALIQVVQLYGFRMTDSPPQAWKD